MKSEFLYFGSGLEKTIQHFNWLVYSDFQAKPSMLWHISLISKDYLLTDIKISILIFESNFKSYLAIFKDIFARP